MAEFFEVLGVVVATLIVAGLAALALAMRTLVRANRVAPGRRSRAPLSWLVAPQAPARLHRRLRRAARVCEASFGLAPAAITLRDVARELVEQAVAIDDRLVTAKDLHDAARRREMGRLVAEVRDVEMSAARLHQLSCDWRRSLDQATAHTGTALVDGRLELHRRLDTVEATLRDLPVAPAVQPAIQPVAPRAAEHRA